jgi:hypothetical protein
LIIGGTLPVGASQAKIKDVNKNEMGIRQETVRDNKRNTPPIIIANEEISPKHPFLLPKKISMSKSFEVQSN